MDLITSSDPVRWVASAYFSLTTVTTIGYGDIVPYTVADMLVSACLRNLPAARGGCPAERPACSGLNRRRRLAGPR